MMTNAVAKKNWHPCHVMECRGGFWWDPDTAVEGDFARCQGSLDPMTPIQRVCQGALHHYTGARWQLTP